MFKPPSQWYSVRETTAYGSIGAPENFFRSRNLFNHKQISKAFTDGTKEKLPRTAQVEAERRGSREGKGMR